MPSGVRVQLPWRVQIEFGVETLDSWDSRELCGIQKNAALYNKNPCCKGFQQSPTPCESRHENRETCLVLYGVCSSEAERSAVTGEDGISEFLIHPSDQALYSNAINREESEPYL